MVSRTCRFIMEHVNCFDRELLPGHVSASAWIVNPVRSHVLLLHHRKLDLWLHPGGHADGDPDILRVVMNEASEETGVAAEHIRLMSDAIFDVDIHTVYESEYSPRHEHFDIRFLMEIDDRLPLPGNDESHQVAWAPLEEVPRFNNTRSIFRLLQKTRSILSGCSRPH